MVVVKAQSCRVEGAPLSAFVGGLHLLTGSREPDVGKKKRGKAEKKKEEKSNT